MAEFFVHTAGWERKEYRPWDDALDRIKQCILVQPAGKRTVQAAATPPRPRSQQKRTRKVSSNPCRKPDDPNCRRNSLPKYLNSGG